MGRKGMCHAKTNDGDRCKCKSVFCGYCINHLHREVARGNYVAEPLK